MKKIAVLYHGDCRDGFGGAYAAWKKFGKRADYFGLKHGGDLPGIKGKEVYIVDFGFKEPVMRKLVRANRVVALDHHVSAEKATKMADEYVYALNNSGAVIAWKYFHPKKPVPLLLRHVQDVDLWKFKLPNTRELVAYMGLVKYDFKIWDKLARELENPKRYEIYAEKGRELLRYENLMIERLLEGAMVAKFEGYKTLVINSPVLHSEIGNRLTKLAPPIAIVWSEKSGIRRVSLRSNGKVDVAKIAEKYGGGGHKAAAGFSFGLKNPFPWKIINPAPYAE